MKRALSFALIFAPALFVYACSDDKTEDPPVTPTPETGSPDNFKPDEDSGTKPDQATDPDSSNPNTNPIEGIAAPTAVPGITLHAEGPVWRGDSLYFSEYTNNPSGVIVKLTPPSTTTQFRNTLVATDYALGNTFDEKTNTFVTCEVSGTGATLVRTPANGGAGTAITLNFDGGVNTFDSLNDIVARKSDGTLYATDPGYQKEQAGGNIVTNHIWRITPTGNVFETALAGRPNGIGLSPDDKTLYVSFTNPITLPPEILKFTIAVDGSIGASTPFAKVPPNDSTADGLAVDSNGNVYLAVKDGVEVFKPDGTKWGKIPTTKGINGLAFGGADKKTLYMTTTTGILQVVTKVPGLAQ